MNYLIVGPPRSGTTFLGEFLQLQGLPYFNELFTAEICRTAGLWPASLEQQYLDKRIDLAFSVDGAGFKMPYNHEQSWAYANLVRRPDLKIIHILRENLLENVASWIHLERAGISMVRGDGTMWNTDGVQVTKALKRPPYFISVEAMREELEWLEFARKMMWHMFAFHPYHEIHMESVFTEEGQAGVCAFLGILYKPEAQPDQVPTARPRAAKMFKNFKQLARAFRGTRYAHFFGETR